jgi:hypothetical protein
MLFDICFFHLLMPCTAVEEAAERVIDAQKKMTATIAEMTQMSMEKATLESKQTFCMPHLSILIVAFLRNAPCPQKGRDYVHPCVELSYFLQLTLIFSAQFSVLNSRKSLNSLSMSLRLFETLWLLLWATGRKRLRTQRRNLLVSLSRVCAISLLTIYVYCHALALLILIFIPFPIDLAKQIIYVQMTVPLKVSLLCEKIASTYLRVSHQYIMPAQR